MVQEIPVSPITNTPLITPGRNFEEDDASGILFETKLSHLLFLA
jgi:hypothetical protein